VNLAPPENGVLPGSTITIGSLVLTSLCPPNVAEIEFSATTGSFSINSSSLLSFDNAAPPTPSIAPSVSVGPTPFPILDISYTNSSSTTESTTFYAIGSPSGKIIIGHITLSVSPSGCTSNGYATTLN
jgi:hypothetical protein